ncbi:MAG: hypothetical protein ABUK11_07240 [Mariprofundaceae bacterium]
MIKLVQSRDAWGTPDFKVVLKDEIEQLNPLLLPLQEGLSTGSHALDNNVEIMVLNFSETDDCIHAKAGILYQSIIAGCSCADDPTPVDERNEYCEVQINIDKLTGETTILLISE